MNNKEILIIGIDPQPSCIAYHIRKYSNDETVDWKLLPLKKKSRTKSSQEWQEYIVRELHGLLLGIIQHYSNQTFDFFVVCEQQKGRVNSIIENSVLCVCLFLHIHVWIVHPMTWKRLSGIPLQKSHYKNKMIVQDMIKPMLDQWMLEHNQTQPLNRYHDLCDAERISKAGQCHLCGESKLKQEEKNILWTNQQSSTEDT